MRWPEVFDKLADYSAEALEKRERSFWAYLARSRFVVIAVILAAFVLHQSELPDKLATQTLDSVFRIRGPQQAKHVYLVVIDDADYQSYFHETSPLRTDVLAQAIEKIATANPSFIAIDLDTSASQFRDMRVPAAAAPIVWGVSARLQDKELIPMAPLGGRPLADSSKQGIMALPQDADGVVRRYFRTLKTRDGPRLSLPAAIRVQHANPPSASELGNQYFLNYYGNRYSLPRMTVSQLFQATQTPSERWSSDGPLTGKVVILGGTFWAARDDHVTPIGPMSGVELMGQCTESELAGDNISGRRRWLMGVLQLLSVLAVMYVYYRFQLRPAFWVALALIPILALVSSYLAFSSFALWAYFLPVLILVLVQQIYAKASEYLKAFKRLQTK